MAALTTVVKPLTTTLIERAMTTAMPSTPVTVPSPRQAATSAYSTRSCPDSSFHKRANGGAAFFGAVMGPVGDRKSTRLNSSHLGISYAVFCLKKKKKYH